MKKLSNNTSLVALVLGASMVLFTLAFISDGGTATVIGIFGLLFGIAYIFAAILTILNLSNSAVELTKSSIYIAAFPLFLFVYYLCVIIEASRLLTITNWIIVILLLVAALASAACGIIALVGKNGLVKKISNLAILAFIGLQIILLVFPIGANTASLGDLPLVFVIFIICYYLVTKDFTELPALDKKDEAKEDKEEPKEENEENKDDIPEVAPEESEPQEA